MNIPVRAASILLHVSLALSSGMAGSARAAEEAPFPGRHPVTIVVPFPPGSTSDLIPRLIAPAIGRLLDTTVVVENRPGANGAVGAIRVATARPDGHTLLLATTGVLAINPWIEPGLRYVPDRDFAAVIQAAATPNVLVVRAGSGPATLRDLVALAAGAPGTVSFASAGNGSTSHLCGEALRQQARIELLHVPYQGPAPALQDVLAGRVDLICDNLSNVIEGIQAGRLRALAVASASPVARLPGVPTAAQAGQPGLEAGIWYGIVAPAGTPAPTIGLLNRVIGQALHEPSVAARLEGLGLTVIADRPAEFTDFIARESARLKRVVEAAGLAPR